MKKMLRNSVLFIWIQYIFFYEVMVYYLRFFKTLRTPYSVRLEAYLGLMLALLIMCLFVYKLVTEKKPLVKMLFIFGICYMTISVASMVYFIVNSKYSFILETAGISTYIMLIIPTFFADREMYKELRLYHSILVLFGFVLLCWVVVFLINGVIFNS